MTNSTHIYKNPEEYSKNNSLQYEFAMQVIDNIEIPPDARILDIGCGDGLITSKMAKKATRGSVIGTDVSKKMVDFASDKYKEYKNLGFMLMDASKNIFKNQFDIITSFNCLHWVKDQENAIKGIVEAGTSSAQIILLFSHKKSLYHHTLDYICGSSKWNDYFRNYINPRLFFTLETYEKMLTNAQLNIKNIAEKEMSHRFVDAVTLKSFFSSSMSQVNHLPLEKRDEFLSEFTNEFIKQLQVSGSKEIIVTFWCLEVIATSFKKILDHPKRIFSRL